MLKDYLRIKNLTMYAFAKSIKVPYSNINSIANNIIKISNMRAGLLKKLAEGLNVSMDEMYYICEDNTLIYSEKYNAVGFVSICNDRYILDYFFKNEHFQKILCKVDEDSTFFINSISLWTLEGDISKKLFRELSYDLFFEKKE